MVRTMDAQIYRWFRREQRERGRLQRSSELIASYEQEEPLSRRSRSSFFSYTPPWVLDGMCILQPCLYSNDICES